MSEIKRIIRDVLHAEGWKAESIMDYDGCLDSTVEIDRFHERMREYGYKEDDYKDIVKFRYRDDLGQPPHCYIPPEPFTESEIQEFAGLEKAFCDIMHNFEQSEYSEALRSYSKENGITQEIIFRFGEYLNSDIQESMAFDDLLFLVFSDVCYNIIHEERDALLWAMHKDQPDPVPFYDPRDEDPPSPRPDYHPKRGIVWG